MVVTAGGNDKTIIAILNAPDGGAKCRAVANKKRGPNSPAPAAVTKGAQEIADRASEGARPLKESAAIALIAPRRIA